VSSSDVVCNHPGLEFLSDNALFQERYSECRGSFEYLAISDANELDLAVETVICRIYYESRCASGKLTLAQFKKNQIADTLSRLERRIDLNSVS
jgi:serine/threonine-protein phosphatase 2A regulatory subunit B''